MLQQHPHLGVYVRSVKASKPITLYQSDQDARPWVSDDYRDDAWLVDFLTHTPNLAALTLNLRIDLKPATTWKRLGQALSNHTLIEHMQRFTYSPPIMPRLPGLTDDDPVNAFGSHFGPGLQSTINLNILQASGLWSSLTELTFWQTIFKDDDIAQISLPS